MFWLPCGVNVIRQDYNSVLFTKYPTASHTQSVPISLPSSPVSLLMISIDSILQPFVVEVITMINIRYYLVQRLGADFSVLDDVVIVGRNIYRVTEV